MTFGAKEGIGFDIAENMIATANKAAEILSVNCKFHATDILALDETYNDRFDFLIVTIGALTWFEDLTAFFAVASRSLKKGGALLVNEMHPLTNMIALNGEEGFDPNDLKKLVHSYFKSDPWIDNDGIEYLTHKKYESKTLYCFSHTLSALLNALADNSFCLTRFDEFDHDISEGFEDTRPSRLPVILSVDSDQTIIIRKGEKGTQMSKSLDKMTNEELWQLFPIILTEHDPVWKERYQIEEASLMSKLQADLSRIDHIGSTSVKGLIAKPTIDILMQIKDDVDVIELKDSIESLGYLYSEQPDNPPPHMMFMKGYTPEGFKGQALHLHVRYTGDWDELYFRDYLRVHADTAEAYGKLKTELQKKFEHDRNAYTDAKTEFIEEITKQARTKFGERYKS